MRRCLACHSNKPESEFPSALSLTCKFCTPFNTGQSPAIQSRLQKNWGRDKLKPDPDDERWKLPKMPDILGDRGIGKVADIPRYNNVRTERPSRPDHDVAKMMMRTISNKMDDAVKAGYVPEYTVDDRPLIDKLHEATFTDAIGLQWFRDHYALRMLLRKAHCFLLDDDTSEMVSDFSRAIAGNLDAARQMAIPPFPVTWIDFNNRKRLDRIKSLGGELTVQAAGLSEAGEPVERVGWLIHPAETFGFYMTYVTEVEQGVVAAPLSYWWHCSSSHVTNEIDEEMDPFIQELALGVKDSGVWPSDAYPCVTPMHIDIMKNKGYASNVRDMMVELAGELRHVWGFLVALGAGHLGMQVQTSPHPKHNIIRRMPNGKPLLPLEHKVLHLHLGKRITPDKVIARAITQHKHRWHEVRSHFRTLKNKDGTVRKRVPVKSHERGDEKLGRIEKTYKVER